jgi:signal transduction histidine kinase/ActR/RegA family two-component response regulator
MIRDWCGCRCVGIRVVDGQGCVPYESITGFSREFCEAESRLWLQKDACACVRVIAGTPDPQDSPVMTPGGSFRCDNAPRFVGGLSLAQQARYRGYCIRSGFVSLGVIPIRYHDETVGAIHVADEREGMIPPACVEFLESMSPLICEAIHRFTVEEQMRTLNEALEQRAVQLQVLAGALNQAEQRERRRLAQILHDHLQQILYAVRLGLARVKNRIADKDLQGSLAQLDEWLNQSIEVSRSLTADLSPPVLYDANFSTALEWLGRQVEESYGLSVEVDAGPDIDVPGEDLRVLLFETVRELLFNVVKHADAKRACVKAGWADGQRLRIVVSDRGAGFNAATRRISRRGAAGIGLLAIRERLEIFGGSMEIESAPGRGTEIVISVPCRQPKPSGKVRAAGKSAAPRSAQTPEPAQPAPAGDRKIRVLLADDHKVLREGLAYLLREQPDLEVVGEAENGRRAVELALQTRPDVVVMDMVMPHMNGIEATRRIVAAMPGVRVIGLSMHDDENMASAMLQAGAVTYLSKGGSSGPLIDAIRSGVSPQEPSNECDHSDDCDPPGDQDHCND